MPVLHLDVIISDRANVLSFEMDLNLLVRMNNQLFK